MKVVDYSLVLLWVILAGVVLGLALYRKLIARGEDFRMHVPIAESSLVLGQESVARRLLRVDFWGQVFTIIVVLYGLVLAAIRLYAMWQNPGVIS